MYKPGTVLKAGTRWERLYYTDIYAPSVKSLRGDYGEWHDVSEGTIIMILAAEPTRSPETEYYYELLVGDKHAQNHSVSIEDKKRWMEIE